LVIYQNITYILENIGWASVTTTTPNLTPICHCGWSWLIPCRRTISVTSFIQRNDLAIVRDCLAKKSVDACYDYC